jgi:hypothetical protein
MASASKSFFYPGAVEMSGLVGPGLVPTLPFSPHENKCPRCSEPAEDDYDWIRGQGRDGACAEITNPRSAFPRHCSSGHWWIPCSTQVYTERQMKLLMLEKKATGNPYGSITLCRVDRHTGQSAITDADRQFADKNEWKLISLTQEEYYGRDVCVQWISDMAEAYTQWKHEHVKAVRKCARKVAALAKKVAEEAANKPKGKRGAKKKRVD